jgi:hypothetical protein
MEAIVDEVEPWRSLRRADRHIGEFGHAVFRPGAEAINFASDGALPGAGAAGAATSVEPAGRSSQPSRKIRARDVGENPICSARRIRVKVASLCTRQALAMIRPRVGWSTKALSR